METKYFFTEAYDKALHRIEDFILESTDKSELVDEFYREHDKVLEFIGENPNTAGIHPTTGDQSWVFGNGRYRLFFKIVASKTLLKIYLIHIIDNREANLKAYPNSSLPTYDEE